MNKVVLLLLGFPRTGSRALSEVLAGLSDLQTKSLGLFRMTGETSPRQKEIVREILFSPLSGANSDTLTSILRTFADSEAQYLIFSDEESSIRITSPGQLAVAKKRFQKLTAADLLFVCYVRNPIHRYPSWVLHHAAKTFNHGTSSPSVRERRVRRTLEALLFSGCNFIVREYKEGSSTISDFFTEVLKRKPPNVGKTTRNSSLSPDFLLGAQKFISQREYDRITPLDIASWFSEDDEIFSDLRHLNPTIEISLNYETMALNQTLKRIGSIRFETSIEPQFECSQLDLEGLRIEDIFRVSTKRIEQIAKIISSREPEHADSAS